MSEKRLEDEVAWVTGSSRGIGRVIADHLAGLGAKVVVHGTTPTSTRAFNEADSLEAVAEIIAAAHKLIEPNIARSLYQKAIIRRDAKPLDGRDGPLFVESTSQYRSHQAARAESRRMQFVN